MVLPSSFFPPFFLLCVFVAALSWVHSQNPNQPGLAKVLEAQLAEAKAAANMHETLQMLPTVSRVLALSTETLDESFRKLATYGDGQYFEPGYMTNVAGINTTFHELLSNRRVIKVLHEFEKLPLEQAKVKAEEFHKIALNSFSKAIDVEVAAYSPDKKYGSFRQNEQFMLMTSVILSASLGDIPTVTHRIKEWEQIITRVEEKMIQKNFPPNLAETLSQYYFLDPTSFVSILMFALERKGQVPDVAKNKIAEMNNCTIVTIPIVAWNAGKTYYDDLRQRGNVSISWEDTQMFIRVYELLGGTDGRNRKNQELQ